MRVINFILDGIIIITQLFVTIMLITFYEDVAHWYPYGFILIPVSILILFRIVKRYDKTNLGNKFKEMEKKYFKLRDDYELLCKEYNSLYKAFVAGGGAAGKNYEKVEEEEENGRTMAWDYYVDDGRGRYVPLTECGSPFFENEEEEE